MVVPIGKALPGLWDGDSVCEPELSVAVGSVQDTFPVATPGSEFPDWAPGQPVILGLSLSDEYEMICTCKDLESEVSLTKKSREHT